MVHGDTVRDALAYVQFDGESLIANFRKKVNRATDLPRAEANAFIADYIAGLAEYTYLEGPGR
jgi:arginine decarboxylase